MDDLIAILTNPAIWVLAITNTLLLYLVGRSFTRAMGQITDANRLVSEGSSKVLEAALSQTKTANVALDQLTSGVVKKTDDSLDAITEHNLGAKQRHEQIITIQQGIADTQAKQTELMNSQASIMQDMSQADVRTAAMLETKIAPTLDEIKASLQSVEGKIDALNNAGTQEKAEILEEVKGMKNAFDRYASLLEQQSKPADSAPNPIVTVPITISSPSPATLGIPAENPADIKTENPEPEMETQP